MTVITPLAAVPAPAVEALLDAAFGADRKARTAYRLRVGARAIPALSFAAHDDRGALVGTLQSWPVRLIGDDGREEPLVMVGPVAVDPAVQGGGIGTALMVALSDAAALEGCAMVMIGDPEYYGRFGFDARATGGWRIDGPVERRRLLARSPRPLPAEGALRSVG